MDEFATQWCSHCEVYQKSLPDIYCNCCSSCGMLLPAFNKSDLMTGKTKKSKLFDYEQDNTKKQRTSENEECETDEESEDSVASKVKELINVDDDNYKESNEDDSSNENDYSGFEEDDDDESLDKKHYDK
ncbi:gastrulation defective protein 1 homolog isoform X1 [Phalaenopsis equestris]|uniref:gastrulation defective protein 1 homolog isoform X1 n=1 Tax=Phalaenopsis equestris TaxID=78828 RepID=UPI0009E4A17B|nr:gastrulation defective protein 1 homolog isoform X1 [Phalaenopsis equestris]XP_020580969.1 gastrulation defective protein 1 homolog isoform X1 [Phalaenopsis equestris]